MDTLVLLQVLRSFERLATSRTWMWFQWCVHCGKIGVNIGRHVFRQDNAEDEREGMD